MGQSVIKNPRKIISQSGGDPSLVSRVTVLENNEYKITYFTEISSSTGTITIPTGATILLDQLQSGVDAYVCTIQNSQPTGSFPQTSGGVTVDVSSFDALGNYTLSGTPSSYPVALIYILKIKAKDYSNLDITKILDLEEINIISQTITNGVTNKSPSEDAVFDALALKADKSNTVLSTYLEVPEQTKPATPTNAFRMYADTSNRLSWIGENGHVRTFDGTANTADRVYTLPDYNLAIKNTNTLTFFPTGFNPADATTYYFSRIAPSTTANAHDFSFPYNGIVRSAIFLIGNNTTNGSAELSTINFRNLTQGTSSLITNSLSTVASSTAMATLTVSGLNIPFLSTDAVCFEWVTPTWATNPTGISISIYLEVEYTS